MEEEASVRRMQAWEDLGDSSMVMGIARAGPKAGKNWAHRRCRENKGHWRLVTWGGHRRK